MYFASLSTMWYFDDNKPTSKNFSERQRKTEGQTDRHTDRHSEREIALREKALESIMGCFNFFFLMNL